MAAFPFSSPRLGEAERDIPRLPLRPRLDLSGDLDSSFDFFRLCERLWRSLAGVLERLRDSVFLTGDLEERDPLRDFLPLLGDFDRLRLEDFFALPADRLRLRVFRSLPADRDRLRLAGTRFLLAERDRLRLPLPSLLAERDRLRLAGLRPLLADRLRLRLSALRRFGDREWLRDLRRGAGDLERDSLERRRREALRERRLAERERLREREALRERERRRFWGLRLRLRRRLEAERERRTRRGERDLERFRLRLRLLEKLLMGFSSITRMRRPLISVLSSFSIARFMSL